MINEHEPITISTDTALVGETHGAVTLRSGASLVIRGIHEGPIDVEEGGDLTIAGVLRGPLNIESLGTATVGGDVVGAVDIKVAGTLIVQSSGRVAGPVTNYGSYTNHGMRVGRVEGRVPDDQPGSVEVPPSGTGAYNYTLPERQ